MKTKTEKETLLENLYKIINAEEFREFLVKLGVKEENFSQIVEKMKELLREESKNKELIQKIMDEHFNEKNKKQMLVMFKILSLGF